MYNTVVVGTDCSPTATRAVEKAAELARLTGAKLYLVSAVSESAMALAAASGASVVADDWLGTTIQDQTVRVEAIAERLRAQGIDVETWIDRGAAADALVSAAESLNADLLVVGDRGLKGIRGMLGSVPSRVTHRAHTDVLVVHTT
jgi:nucleotide-binding universal stress UspA family protein